VKYFSLHPKYLGSHGFFCQRATLKAERGRLVFEHNIEGGMMRTHTLKANCQTVHFGGFSSKLGPALRVNPGDRIEVETYTAFCLKEAFPQDLVTPDLQDIIQNLPEERRLGPGNHLLTGPISVEGAEPGDVLEVGLEDISLMQPVGFNLIRPGWGALPDRFSQASLRAIPLDLEQGTAEFPPGKGIRIPLLPFFGVLGVALPDENVSSIPPGRHGGNMDNRHFLPGSRIFLPVFVPGAMFSLGDGHAVQGDGEVNLTAIETSMKGTITLKLRTDMRLSSPVAETPGHIIAMGFGSTLDDAFEEALLQAINFLETNAGLSFEEAYVLCSLCVNFHITQVVNPPQKGVHGMIPKKIFQDGITLS
jgi:acetamidase/formamidase